MDANNYNRDACLEYFKAYKDCKRRMVNMHNTMLACVISRSTLASCGCDLSMQIYYCIGGIFRGVKIS